jgi:hypothetical protein
MTSRHHLTLNWNIELIHDNNSGNGLSQRVLAEKIQYLTWMEMMQKLRLFTTPQEPQLHNLVSELESKLTDVYIHSIQKKTQLLMTFCKRANVFFCWKVFRFRLSKIKEDEQKRKWFLIILKLVKKLIFWNVTSFCSKIYMTSFICEHLSILNAFQKSRWCSQERFHCIYKDGMKKMTFTSMISFSTIFVQQSFLAMISFSAIKHTIFNRNAEMKVLDANLFHPDQTLLKHNNLKNRFVFTTHGRKR